MRYHGCSLDDSLSAHGDHDRLPGRDRHRREWRTAEGEHACGRLGRSHRRGHSGHPREPGATACGRRGLPCRGEVDAPGLDRRARPRGVGRRLEADAPLGRHVRSPDGGGRGGGGETRCGGEREDGRPGSLPGGADLHGERGLVGPGTAAGLEPRPLSRHAGAGPRLRAPREDARIRRDQADARRHGLVPRSAPAPSEDDAGYCEVPDRGGSPGRPSRHRPRAESRRREGSRHARRDGARARRARPLRRVDPRRDEEPPCLLHPDDGHLRVPGGHASVRRRSVLRSAGGKRTSAVRRDTVPLARIRRGVRAPLSELSKRARAPAGASGEPRAPPRGRSPRRARHRHVGLPGTRRLDRVGPVRQGRPLASGGDPGGDGDRRPLARPREGPWNTRIRQASRPPPPGRRPPGRCEKRPRHRCHLQSRPARWPRSLESILR